MTDYSGLTRDQLLRLALQKGELTDEARFALDIELGRRKISPGDIGNFAAEESEAALAEEKVVREALFWGVGKKLVGKRNYFQDSRFRVEEFNQTLWFVLFYIPIVPLGTYRVRRLFRRNWLSCVSDRYRVLARLPLDRQQIFSTWITTIAVLLFVFLALPWLLSLASRQTH